MNAAVKSLPAPTPPAAERFKLAQLRLAELKGERETWDPHWRDLQDYFLTRRGRWITDARGRGSKRNQKLVDPTPKFSARTLGAGMHAGSTNPAMPWFRLKTPDPELMEFPSVSRWLYAVENLMRDVFSRTNLYAVLPTNYMEAGVFGTSPIVMLEHPQKIIHFVPKTIGSYYTATNSDGVVDTLYCEYQMTVRQLVTDYTLERVSSVVANQYAAGRYNEVHDVLHTIEPNLNRNGAFDNQNMPFKSVYWEMKTPDKEPLRSSGFEDNPIGCFRWETTELTDAYGSSCGMDALGVAKAMQLQTKRKAQALDKVVDPTMVGDPALKNSASTLLPGEITWAGFTANGIPRFQPTLPNFRPDLKAMMEDIQDVRDLTRTAMYTDLFLAITLADPRNATVPEIDARKEEQILALGPVLQNHEDGLIKPIIDRTFNIMLRRGMLPEPPPELSGVQLKVELIGALAQAFRSIAAGKIDRFTGYVGAIAKAQADSGQPVTAFDKWDTDQSVDEYAQAIGVPPTIVRGDEDVAKIRADRAQAQQQQQLAASAQPLKDASIAAKNLSETQMQGGQSALDAVADAA